MSMVQLQTSAIRCSGAPTSWLDSNLGTGGVICLLFSLAAAAVLLWAVGASPVLLLLFPLFPLGATLVLRWRAALVAALLAAGVRGVHATTAEVAVASTRGRQLMASVRDVNNASGLVAALGDVNVERVVLAAGEYLLESSMACERQYWSTASGLCIARPVTIEAAQAGTVVLDGRRQWTVVIVTAVGVELIGLNITGGDGECGGLCITRGGEATLNHCNIYNNEASTGGGLEISGEATLSSCNIYDNKASFGGGLYIKGAGVATLNNCKIYSNEASLLSWYYTYYYGDPQQQCTGGSGGGLEVSGGQITLNDCLIYDNQAAFGGGALVYPGGTLAMARCQVSNNTAATGAGAGWALQIFGSGQVGHREEANVTLSDCTFIAGDSTRGELLVDTAGSDIDWGVCAPGRSPGEIGANLPLALPGGNFTGCPFQCPKGWYGPGGNTIDLREVGIGTCEVGCRQCGAGATCPSVAMGEPQRCGPGRYFPFEGGQDQQCRPCALGEYQPDSGAQNCTSCEAGRFAAAENSTACELCAVGGYCEDPGATSPSVFKLCKPGRWSDTPGLDTRDGCTACGEGKFQPISGANSSAACRECQRGTATAQGGLDECPSCASGRFQNETGQTVCSACIPGSYCEAGAAAPLPCPPGSFSGATGLGSSTQCEVCPQGAFCFAGALRPTNCSAGTHAEEERSELCLGCDEGSYQDAEGATTCKACRGGHTCPKGSVVEIPATCGEGTYLNESYACVQCPVGTVCAGGAAQPRNCSVGSFQAEVGRSECDDCKAGTFQPERGQTACAACDLGTICAPGASTALPCPAGRHENASQGVAMTSVDDCAVCPTGAFCPTGAGQPSLCAPGSYQQMPERSSCERCPAGRYQDGEGATACEQCTLYSWCAEGSSAATPCGEGKEGTRKGLSSPEQCVSCPKGSWCSTGAAFACAEGTWLDLPGASNRSACNSCPEHATTLKEGSTGLAECVCDAGFVLTNEADGAAVCAACPLPGTNCSKRGVVLSGLPLAPRYWRSGGNSTDPRLCTTYANVPGEKRCLGGNATCAGLLSGVYCTSCPADTFLDRSGECLECGELSAASALIVTALVLVGAGLLLLVMCSARLSRALGRSSAARRAAALGEAGGLAAKAKQLVSFYQMATSVQSAFGVTFPSEVRAVLSFFSVFSLNLFEFGLPVECMGLGSFLQRLTFMLVAPLCLLACVPPLAWWLLRQEEGSASGARAVLLRALPMALRVLFVVFPLTSAVAVQAYDCEGFDDGTHYWLRADLSLQCGWGDDGGLREWTAEYRRVSFAAALAIVLYAIGVPLLFLALLLACRKQLSRQAPVTPLSSSLGFLCAEYRKRWFVWEVVESMRKLFFVSLVRLVSPGTLSQLLVALVFSQTLLVFQLSAAPYKRASDNFLSVLSCTSYGLLLLGAVALKNGTFTEALDGQLSQQLRYIFGVPVTPVLVVLLGSTLASITFAAAVAAREGLRDLRQPKLRFAASGASVVLPLPQGKTHHLFISHVWGSAQDQARVLRGRLQAVVPGLRVWLDVEDLEDISALEEAVDAMQAILIFVSQGYFQSANCMRELVRCVATGKPLVAVAERDPAHGGLSEAEARQQCLASGARFEGWGFDVTSVPSAATLADALLGPADAPPPPPPKSNELSPPDASPIVFERVGAFQQTMLRLIVQRLEPTREMYLPREVGAGRKPAVLPPRGRFHLWCSPQNPGARELIDELKRFGGWEGQLLVTEDAAQMGEADQLLLLLNRATWAEDARKDTLTAEVRAPLEASPRRPLLLVHETDESHGGVAAFGHFFGPNVTPAELLRLKLYAEIAIPMKESAFRKVSLAMLAASIVEQAALGGAHRPLWRRIGARRQLVGLTARPFERACELQSAQAQRARDEASEGGGTRSGRKSAVATCVSVWLSKASRRGSGLAEGSQTSAGGSGMASTRGRWSRWSASGASDEGSNPGRRGSSNNRRSSAQRPSTPAAGPNAAPGFWMADTRGGVPDI